MPTFILKRDTTATLPHQPLAVRAMTAPRDDRLRLAVVMEDGSALPGNAVRTPTPGLLILPRVPGRIRLEAYREGGGPFDAGTILVMSIKGEGNDPDPVQVELRTEVSGLDLAPVAALAPAEHGVTVALLQDDAKPLAGWAGLAASATRTLIGSHRPPEGQTRDLSVLVDASASMTPWVQNGAIAILLSTLAGIDHVCGRQPNLDVRLSAESSGWAEAEASTVGETLAAQLSVLPPQSGFRSRAFRPLTDRSLVIVSDAVPVDWQPGESVIVVLARAGAGRLVVREPRRDVAVVELPDKPVEEHFDDREAMIELVTDILEALGVETPSRRNS